MAITTFPMTITNALQGRVRGWIHIWKRRDSKSCRHHGNTLLLDWQRQRRFIQLGWAAPASGAPRRPAVWHHQPEDWLHLCVDTQQDILYPVQCQTTDGVGRFGNAICEVPYRFASCYRCMLKASFRRGFVVDPFVLRVKLFWAIHSSMLPSWCSQFLEFIA